MQIEQVCTAGEKKESSNSRGAQCSHFTKKLGCWELNAVSLACGHTVDSQLCGLLWCMKEIRE